MFDKAYESNNSDIWNLWLSSVGIILLIWLIVDIEIYIRKINKIGKGNSFLDDFKLVEGPDGELNMEIPMTKGIGKMSLNIIDLPQEDMRAVSF